MMLVNFRDPRDFHASDFILGPDDSTVLIRDMRKTNPQWKFAGGKKQLIKLFGKKRRGETPLETVLREIPEETGLRVKRRNTHYVTLFELATHNKHFFFSTIDSFKRLVPLSKEYEEAKVFACEELRWLPNFHPLYRGVFLEHIQPHFLQSLT